MYIYVHSWTAQIENSLVRMFVYATHYVYVCILYISDVTYDQVWWPLLGICALHLIHPRCTHTHTPWTHTHTNTHHEHAHREHTHTVNTHPEQWAAIYAAAPGEQLGVWCPSFKGHFYSLWTPISAIKKMQTWPSALKWVSSRFKERSNCQPLFLSRLLHAVKTLQGHVSDYIIQIE